jgi:hypothetical protein
VFSVLPAPRNSRTAFSVLSVPRLYKASPLAAERVLVEFRGSRVIEQEIARRLHIDLKCPFLC